MKKEQKLKYIDALIKEVRSWPVLSPIIGINSFIERAQIQLKKIMGPQTHYIKEIDVFSNGENLMDYDIKLIEVLKRIRFDIEVEEENNNNPITILPIEKTIEMNEKIFVSHSSKDHDLVRKFIDHILILGLGIKRENIFCTSIDGLGIKSGDDFKKAIVEELTKSKAVIQIITKNYKTSEICLNEMGAAWLTKSIVIPVVATPFNYDVGFIHASSIQLKLNEEKDLFKLYDDHKGSLFKNEINIANYSDQIKSFLDFIKKYVEQVDQKKKSTFFYNEKSRLSGKLHSDVFGHPPMEKFEDSKSFHRYYYIVPETPIDVLSSEMFIKEGNFNTTHFNIEKIQIASASQDEKISLRQLEGKNIEVTGKFMGWHTAWHRTEVLLFFSDIKEVV